MNGKSPSLRVVVLSLVDDWQLGPLLESRGHQIVAWVRPSWSSSPRPKFMALRRLVKGLLSLSTPPRHVQAAFDASRWLDERGIPKLACKDVNDPGFIATLQERGVDLVVVSAYPQIIKRQLLDTPRLGTLNCHPSLLPRYAGPQPVFWVLRNGEPHAGTTVHEMVEKLDAGAILGQTEIAIGPEETAGQLLQRLSHAGAHLIADSVDALANGTARAQPQDLTLRTYQGRRKPEDVELNWEASARELSNLLRAVQPFTPLETTVDGRRLNIFEARPLPGEHPSGEPGEVLARRGRSIIVQTGDGCLEVRNFEIVPLRGWLNRLAGAFFPKVGSRLR